MGAYLQRNPRLCNDASFFISPSLHASIPPDSSPKSIGFQTQPHRFHFFNTLYYICRAVTYSFTITYLEYFMAGNFRLKISTICTIHAKFKQYNFLWDKLI